jgi:hypothetical protein
MTTLAEQLFPGLDPLERTKRFEDYKASLDKAAGTRNERGNSGQIFDYAERAGRRAAATRWPRPSRR